LGLVALVALMTGVSQASLSRVEGMDLTVPALSQFTDDYVNIYYYPTSVVRQNNLVMAELGHSPDPDGDIGYSFPLDQTFTVIRNFPRFGAIAFQMKGSALNESPTVAGNLNHEQLDAIWGKAFTKLDLAVRLDITNSKFDASATNGIVTATSKFLGDDFTGSGPFPFFGIGSDLLAGNIEMNTIGITPAIAIHMQNDNRIEGAVTYRRYTLDRTESNTTAGFVPESFKDAGNASYAVIARGVLAQGDKHVWYPAAWYVSDDLGWAITNAGNVAGANRNADETYKYYGIGISDNMKVNENNLLLWGVMVSQTKHEYTRGDDNTGAGPADAVKKLVNKESMFPQVFAAIETDATKWLKVRIGATRALVSTKDEETDFGTPAPSFTTKTRGSDFTFNLGTGIRWNNLDIDMTLNQKFPLTGGYILSGDQASPFTRASATYHF
jgi:hypothetical protein